MYLTGDRETTCARTKKKMRGKRDRRARDLFSLVRIFARDWKLSHTDNYMFDLLLLPCQMCYNYFLESCIKRSKSRDFVYKERSSLNFLSNHSICGICCFAKLLNFPEHIDALKKCYQMFAVTFVKYYTTWTY